MTEYAIPLSIPCVGEREAEYAADAVRRGDLAQGEYIGRFERMVAEYVGARHAVAVSSGTAALHLALLAAGVGPGDEVIVPALTFIAPANAVRYCGAEPVFVDVEEDTWCMDYELEELAAAPRTRAVIPVHLLGHPCDMPQLYSLPGQGRGHVAVIQDATEALGAWHRGMQVGRCSELTCLSFNGNKLISTGGGGMVLTDSGELAAKVRYLANQAKDDPAEYVHESVGYNYRLSNIQAAVGLAQAEQLPAFLSRKREIASVYRRELADVPGISFQAEAPWARSAWWLTTIRLNEAEFGMSARQLRDRLAEQGIEGRSLWTPCHMQPVFKDCYRGPLPVAELLHRECLSLPSSVGLTEDQQQTVISAIRGLRQA